MCILLFSSIRYFYNRVQCLFPVTLSGPQDSVRSVRENIRNNTLHMIVKLAYCYQIKQACSSLLIKYIVSEFANPRSRKIV